MGAKIDYIVFIIPLKYGDDKKTSIY